MREESSWPSIESRICLTSAYRLELNTTFEKTYDYVDGDFLDKVLRKKGLGYKWRLWLQSCIWLVQYSILINVKPRGKSRASRGLRQDHPLLLFSFCWLWIPFIEWFLEVCKVVSFRVWRWEWRKCPFLIFNSLTIYHFLLLWQEGFLPYFESHSQVL